MYSPLAVIALALGALRVVAQNHTHGKNETQQGQSSQSNGTDHPSTSPIDVRPYPLNATVSRNLTNSNGDIVTTREPHPSAMPLRWEGRAFESPNNASWWVAGKQARFATYTSRQAPLDTYWPVFDALFLLSHQDNDVLPQELNIWLWRPQSDPSKPFGPMQLGGGGFIVDVPPNINASDGYYIRLANVSDSSITYYDTPKFEIKKAGAKGSGEAAKQVPVAAALVCLGVGLVAVA
ncbi:uncharacterized protein LOC62_01G001762 [Vanrija pseudolonga]|uniref:Uncharacterized protein n=1 Tax=Vanrija pseudolonga TaxID=143232 RepID=A0AAF1BI02_9TREE|nr:hypothetical protein LOC62_01G001762 [Vanrija pseudolonga]